MKKSDIKLFSAALLVGSLLFGNKMAFANAQSELEAFIKKHPFAEGQFHQTVVSPSGAVKQKSAGHFAFSRPGKFKWQIDQPYPQLVVADGKSVVNFDVQMKQASRTPMNDAINSTPAALLFGSQDLSKLFVFKDEADKDGKQWLTALPKNKETLFESMRVGMEGGLPVSIEIFDAMGQTTQLNLVSWQFGQKKPDAFFSYITPAGVDLLERQ